MNEQVLCARHWAKPGVLSFLIYFGTKSYEVGLLSWASVRVPGHSAGEMTEVGFNTVIQLFPLP